ncbi:MAG TPA: hypothetical protein VGN57_12940 [Pirellulaceae bacterium]|jgi:hypothetical protein|nr:hypothetical protein [Pirellulaceae bacterium]
MASKTSARYVVAFGLLGRPTRTVTTLERVGLYAFADDAARAEELARECVRAVQVERGITLLPRIIVCGEFQTAAEVLDDATELFSKLVEIMNAVARSAAA